MDQTAIRLTSLSHGGGCGCKISPEVLSEMLSSLPTTALDPALMLGIGSNDDAAVYRLNDRQAVVATTDFFMPIVDDPFDFGRIAATNAISDVYAVGGRPIFALAIVGMPVDKLPVETIRQIMAGGAEVCKQAGISIAGGHSIDAPEPIYGLVALGVVDPDFVKRNDTARPGDVLVLGKSLGVGILSAVMKKGELSDSQYQEMVEVTTRLNSVGADLAELPGLTAMTDVTGFGLLGHLLEMCRGSDLTATLDLESLPIIPSARALAQAGHNTGAAGRNWASYGAEVTLPEAIPEWQKNLLVDPQTSGGLLVACDPAEVDQVLDLFHKNGHADAAVIGKMAEGDGRVTVR
jgi:selenide,water dikinase